MTAWMCILPFQKIAPKMSPKFKMFIELAPRWSREKYCSKRLAHWGAGGTHLSSRDILPDERRERKGGNRIASLSYSPRQAPHLEIHFRHNATSVVNCGHRLGKLCRLGSKICYYSYDLDGRFVFGRGKSRSKNWHTEGFAYIRCLVPRDDIYRPPKTTPPPTSSRSGASPRERHSWPLWYLWWNRSDLAVDRQGIHRAWKEKEKK